MTLIPIPVIKSFSGGITGQIHSAQWKLLVRIAPLQTILIALSIDEEENCCGTWISLQNDLRNSREDFNNSIVPVVQNR